MPFIPAAILPSIIGAGATVGSSIVGSKLAKSKPSALEQAQLDQASQAGKRGMEISQNLFDLGMPATQQPVDYWSSILSGDRGRMTSAMGPELSRIGEGYQQAAKTSSALMPRGGPTPDFLAQQPYNQQRDVSTMFQQARPQAAQQLAGSGSNLLANAINSLYGSTAAGRSILDFEAQRRERDRAAGQKLGEGIYSTLFPEKGGGLGGWLDEIFKPKPKVKLGDVQGGMVPELPTLPRVGLPPIFPSAPTGSR